MEARNGGVAALDIQSVGMRFGGLAALDGVSLTVAPGERWGVIGPNGAGKTTLFRIISGERRPTTGRVALFGEDCTHWSPQRHARKGVGRTFQVNNVFRDLTVIENLMVAAQAADAGRFTFWRPAHLRTGLESRVDDALEHTGLQNRRGAHAAELSHGEARQLEVALALARDCRVLLLDEPAAGLSPAERITMKQLIVNLPEQMTVVLIEHDMNLTLEIVGHILCLNNGRPVARGTPNEIRANDEVQRVYLGSQ